MKDGDKTFYYRGWCASAFFAGLVSSGCDTTLIEPGGGAASPAAVTVYRLPAPVVEAAATHVAEQSSGVPGEIEGRIRLKGSLVLPPLVAAGGSAVDKSVCAKDAPIPDESLVIGDNSALANVFIWVEKKPAWFKSDGKIQPAKADQLGCIFRPHATIATAGQPLALLNSDSVTHNIQTYPALNPSINVNLPPGARMDTEFKRPEQKPVAAKCSIHPWMQFWTLVVDHPFAAVSGLDGAFKVSDLRPGKYKFRVWHERADYLERSLEVTVKSGEVTKIDLEYDAARFGGAK